MISKLLTFALALYAITARCQFTGKVEYFENYESKNPKISSAEFTKFAGTKRVLSIQDSCYKNVTYGQRKSTMLYRGGKENKLYKFDDDIDSVFWIDALHSISPEASGGGIEDSGETPEAEKKHDAHN